jgi:hypothetical protein
LFIVQLLPIAALALALLYKFCLSHHTQIVTQIVQLAIAALAGYSLVRAAQRWYATLRVLGARRSLSGAALMWQIRTKRPFRSGGAEVRLWPIHPTVPVLFELQVFFLALLLVYSVKDWYTVAAILRDPVMIYAVIWALARASESVLPPCLLYLGVSEPGQFKQLRYYVNSRSWLAVSAIDQENPEVNSGDRPMAALRSIPGLRLFGIIPFQRRRLESIRTSDDLWESSVRLLIDFVPLIVADLRSYSAIVNNELLWVLQARATERLVVVTRDDGGTSLDALLRRCGLESKSIARSAPNVDELNGVVAALLDGGQTGATRLPLPTVLVVEAGNRLAAEISGDIVSPNY